MKKLLLIVALFGATISANAQINELKGFGSVRFFIGTAAQWAASTKILAVNEFAIVSDQAGVVKQGQALTSLQRVGPAFALLPNMIKTFAPAAINRTPVSINATATATAAQLVTGAIKSTSAAATSITLPTPALTLAALQAAQGTSFDFIIDNSAGASTVTIVAGTGWTALAVVTGGNTLTVASGSVGIFRIYFKSGTTAVIGRLA